MKKVLFTALTIALLSASAMAGTNYNVCFNSLDANYDGEMSKSEFIVAFSDGDMAVFEAADGDKDGVVSHEEWEDYKASKGFEETEHSD